MKILPAYFQMYSLARSTTETLEDRKRWRCLTNVMMPAQQGFVDLIQSLLDNNNKLDIYSIKTRRLTAVLLLYSTFVYEM